ncbi:MAG TPA: NADPH:quinone oxidoreductase family protein [Streptosporangiaceae bacterium]|nr:NADPH:quinone oxidoreductase family protein [Streptosporangiaceae bacterium]
MSAEAPGVEETQVVDLPDPAAGPGEVLIRVRFCGVNYPDVLLLQDRYQVRPRRPFSPGGEIGGEVASTGEGVTEFAPGDRVMARMAFGGMAELVAVPTDRVQKIPDDMPFDDAAAIQTTYLTAYHALVQRAAVQSGERLLVLGAAGGVGIAAVQIGKALGATVIAATSSEAKTEIAKSSGADIAFTYPAAPSSDAERRELSALIKGSCPGSAADVVFDGVGGDYTEAALRAMAPDGRLLIVGFPAGIPRIPMNLVLLKRCQIVGVLYGGFAAAEPAADRVNCDEVIRLYQAGAIRPLISGRFPADQARQAIDELKERRVQGKVVVAL